MKKLAFLLVLLCLQLTAQPGTEVFVADLSTVDGVYTLSGLRNISNNEGYDNQPSFMDANTLVYAATRNGQTDILTYDLQSGSADWLSTTPGGSEYSPLKIPGIEALSAIRLDKDGLQQLYLYDLASGKSEVLLEGLKVGYHVWYTRDILVTTVLVDNRMDLVVSNLKDGTNNTIQKNVGRSLHKIPNSDLISYISKESGTALIKSLHPFSGVTEEIVGAIPEADDMCWLPDRSILMPRNNAIARFRPGGTTGWELFHQFQQKEINEISRMALSPDGKRIALVSGESVEVVIQKQVDSFNAGNLDAFVSCFSEDVLVQNFPADTSYVGAKRMKESYRRFLANNPDTSVEVTGRIIIGNKVIDAETASVAGRKNRQAALYEISKGKITSMTFIHEEEPDPMAEKIVQQQLEAYNARDIDKFLATYTDDVKLFNHPNQLFSEGKEKMREGYSSFFIATPDLNCEIKNRIVVGNKVIDEEYITMNGNNFSAVAIYEVVNGKIAKVTFLR